MKSTNQQINECSASLARRYTAGFCLVELMIALAAGAVILAGTLQAMQHLDHRFRVQQETVGRNQDLRLGLEAMAGEWRRAGSGVGESTGVVTAEPDWVEFDANLDGVQTVLTAPVVPGAYDLPVEDGRDWPRNRRVALCRPEDCVQHRLIRDGRRRTLTLETPLDHPLPAGTPVLLVNRVRYSLGRDQRGGQSLMRWADGGANPLIGAVDEWRLHYLDREGQPTSHLDRIARVRMELTLRGSGTPIRREFGLPTP